MKKLIISLSAIAGFSITKYFLNSFEFNAEWWALLVLAVLTGLFTWVISELSFKFRVANALISTGILLLLLMTVIPLFKNFEFLAIIIGFVLVAIPTELIANGKLRVGDLILDPIIAVSTALLIQKVNIQFFTPLILFVAFVIIILLDISIKGVKKSKQNIVEIEHEEPNLGKIDIEV